MAAVIIAPRPGGMKPPRPPSKGGEGPKISPPKPPTDDSQPDTGGKVSREDCVFIPAGKHCGSCQKYSAETGECSKVEGVFDPEDACVRYFTAIGEDMDNDSGAEPDMDADDQQGPPPPAGAGQ